MSAKVLWADYKALDAAILDTFEASCSEYQVFIVHYFLHTKDSKAYHRPRYQMYADVQPSQDNRVSQCISVFYITREIYSENTLRMKLSIFRIFRMINLGHMLLVHVIIF